LGMIQAESHSRHHLYLTGGCLFSDDSSKKIRCVKQSLLHIQMDMSN
jgi:hypothetical protein